MYCLKNIEFNKMPNDIIMRYLTLYKRMGRNKETFDAIKDDYQSLSLQTLRTDTYFLGQWLDLNIKDERYQALIMKNVKAKTNAEQFLKNTLETFKKIHDNVYSFELFDREIQDLLKFLYKNASAEAHLNFAKETKKEKARINLLSANHTTKRDVLNDLITSYHQTRKKDQYEVGFIDINFYIDFIQLAPFKAHNEVIGLFILYILLIQNDYQAFHLSSFFEKLFKRKHVFEKLKKEALRNWADGLADTHDLHRFILDVAIEAYQDVHEILRNYTFDKQLNKSDYIESTINRLPEVFSKDDIKKAHPTISLSTINRTLARLRDAKKIRPLGKGRSAKWMKLYQNKKTTLNEQLNLKL